MGVLEDLFLTQREFPLPCLDTPEFIGFIDSAAYELSKNYSSTSLVSFNEDEIPDIFDQLHESQVSKRLSESFSDVMAIKTFDYLHKYTLKYDDLTSKIVNQAQEILKPLMNKYDIDNIGLSICFEDRNHDLNPGDALYDPVEFIFAYQAGWTAFVKLYPEIINELGDHFFEEEIVNNYFVEPERSLPFFDTDLISAVESARAGEFRC